MLKAEPLKEAEGALVEAVEQFWSGRLDRLQALVERDKA